MSEKNYKEIIENFCDKSFTTDFLNKNRDTLKITGDISDVQIKIHHRRYQKGKRLITTCYFKEDGQSRKFTFKIRIYNGKNLAYKSWLVTKDIYKVIDNKEKYIIEPLAYFDDYDLFVYKTAPGKPLSSLLKRGLIEDDELAEKITVAARCLADFHKLDINSFNSRDIYNEHNIFTQISNFYDYLGERDLELSPAVRAAIERARRNIGQLEPVTPSLVHGDFQIENLVFDGSGRLRLIDFDLTEINDPLIDVGNFLVQIYYGGWISRNVGQLRELFLNEYLRHNPELDKKNFNRRINLYASLAKIRNLTLNIFGDVEMEPNTIKATYADLRRIENRLDNLDADPLSFFLK